MGSSKETRFNFYSKFETRPCVPFHAKGDYRPGNLRTTRTDCADPNPPSAVSVKNDQDTTLDSVHALYIRVLCVQRWKISTIRKKISSGEHDGDADYTETTNHDAQ
jgi:hypothetical protein